MLSTLLHQTHSKLGAAAMALAAFAPLVMGFGSRSVRGIESPPTRRKHSRMRNRIARASRRMNRR